MIPAKLAEEIERLCELGHQVEVIEDGTRFYVVLKAFQLPDGQYTPAVTDLMVIADYQYPMSRLDMYWTDPQVHLAPGALPLKADQFEVYGNRRWQRWSWHYPAWDPAKHNVRTHVEVFRDRLARGN
jgi:hypothetical protein